MEFSALASSTPIFFILKDILLITLTLFHKFFDMRVRFETDLPRWSPKAPNTINISLPPRGHLVPSLSGMKTKATFPLLVIMLWIVGG